MCWQFDCSGCKTRGIKFCRDWAWSDDPTCGIITDIEPPHKDRCYTCIRIEGAIKKIEHLLWMEPWRGGAAREAWETAADARDWEKTRMESNGRMNVGASGEVDRGWGEGGEEDKWRGEGGGNESASVSSDDGDKVEPGSPGNPPTESDDDTASEGGWWTADHRPGATGNITLASSFGGLSFGGHDNAGNDGEGKDRADS